MVQKKKFLVLIALPLLVVGYAASEYYSSQKSSQAPTSKNFDIDSWDFESFNKVEIKNSSQSEGPITAELIKGKWKLTSPISDVANTSKVKSFTKDLFYKPLVLVDAKSPDWSQFGFNDKSLTLNMDIAQKNLNFIVSKEPAFDGRAYVKQNDSLYTGAANWLALYNKNMSVFRDFTINRYWVKPNNIIFKSEGKNLSILKVDNLWKLEAGKPADKVNQEKVKAAINGLTLLLASQIVSENKSIDSLKNYGLDKEKFSITLKGDSEKVLNLKFSESYDGKTYVVSSLREVIFEVLTPTVSRWDLSAKDLIDVKN